MVARSVGSRRELCRQFCARPEEQEAMVWFGCADVSCVRVCAEGEGFGDTFSRRHAGSTRPEVGRGAYYLAALNTYSCSRSCFKLVALFSNSVKVNKPHSVERNGAQWHYNTLRLYFGYQFKLDRKYIIAISNEMHTIC